MENQSEICTNEITHVNVHAIKHLFIIEFSYGVGLFHMESNIVEQSGLQF